MSTIFTAILKIIYRIIFKVIPYGEVSVWSLLISCLGIQCGWINQDQSYGVNETLWYISVLLLCYIVFWITTKLAIKLKINEIYLYLFVIFCGMGIRDFKISFSFINGWAARGYYAFFAGLILAWLVKKYSLAQNQKIKVVCFLVCCVLSVFYCFVHFLYRRHYLSDIDFATHNIRYILVFVVYPSLIIISFIEPVGRLFNNVFMEGLGQISFDVYIWHLPLFYLWSISDYFFNFSKENDLFMMICFTVFVECCGFISYIGRTVVTVKLYAKE